MINSSENSRCCIHSWYMSNNSHDMLIFINKYTTKITLESKKKFLYKYLIHDLLKKYICVTKSV